MPRLPPWMRLNLRTDAHYARVQGLLSGLDLHTVCKSARCPNRMECWNRGTATFLILGNTCTRHCAFCAVPTGRPGAVDPDEPARVVEAVRTMGLRHAVLTSVTRDDLPDGGAGHFAAVIGALRAALPTLRIEVLTSDFQGDEAALALVLQARPEVFNHNLETVRRLQPVIRPQASYARSLGVLRAAAAWQPALAVKSGLMLGLGETEPELFEALADLRAAGCRLLTLGQYLAPTAAHLPTQRFVPPEDFERYAAQARALGFEGVAAGPLVRSSYRAHELLAGAAVAEGA